VRECRVISAGPVVTMLVCLVSHIARGAMGAAGTRHSPRPLFSKGAQFMHNSGEQRRGNADAHLDIIARSEATKQSIFTFALAVDCFAEPVIGRAFARPVGSQ